MTQINIHRVENGWIVNHYDDGKGTEFVFHDRHDLLMHVRNWIPTSMPVLDLRGSDGSNRTGSFSWKCCKCDQGIECLGDIHNAENTASAAGWSIGLGGCFCPHHSPQALGSSQSRWAILDQNDAEPPQTDIQEQRV